MILDGEWQWVIKDGNLTDIQPGEIQEVDLRRGYEVVTNPEICDFCYRYISRDQEALRHPIDDIAICLICINKALEMMNRRSNIRAALRAQILERDGYVCQYCGDSKSPLQVDHIVPVRHGGKNYLYNLITACERCNRIKKDRPLGMFLRELRDAATA